MRVLTLLDFYVPHWTGLTANARAIAEGLAARGHQVTVLTTRHDRATPAQEEIGGVEVLRVPALGRLSRGLVAPGLLRQLARRLGAADLVHLHTPMLHALPLAALVQAGRRPLVVTHQGDLVLPSGLGNRVLQAGGNAMIAATLRLADRATTLTADYARHSPVLRPVSGKLAALPPPIRLPSPDPGGAAAVRERHGGDPLVGFAGRWVEEKGFDYLLAALPLLLERHPGAQLAFAGERHITYERFWERCAPLLRAVEPRVSFVGLLDRRELASFYAACDVFALPSRTDCFANVQVEAMLAGTPVVAADIPGAREPVSLTGMGLLVPSGDPVALAAGLAEAYERRHELRAARLKALEVFDPERALDRYEHLFLEVVGSR